LMLKQEVQDIILRAADFLQQILGNFLI